MKRCVIALLLPAVFFAACAGQGKVIFYPDTPPEQNGGEPPGETWRILESQNGDGDSGLPEWVRLYLEYGIPGVESIYKYSEKYLFIGENRGDNFSALRQWADNFTADQDMPRLVARRVEKKLVASASLYPDDEYGEYFASLIRDVSDGEYPGAAREEVFWIRRQITLPVDGDAAGTDVDGLSADVIIPAGDVSIGEETTELETVTERYEFFVLISADKAAMEEQIRGIMEGVTTAVPPTRNQAAAIDRIQETFFEEF